MLYLPGIPNEGHAVVSSDDVRDATEVFRKYEMVCHSKTIPPVNRSVYQFSPGFGLTDESSM